MTKTCKKVLTSVFLALLLVVSLVGIVACNKNPKTVAYSVTVQTDATTPASGVEVSISKGGATYEAKTTGADGKVTFDLVPDYYDVELDNLPAHYLVPDSVSLSLTADDRDLVVTLEKAFTYTVHLVDTNGDPYYAEGVTVGICTMTGNCLEPVPLSANGTAVIDVKSAGDYKVRINGLPADVTYDQDDHYYTGEYFSATLTEMTITIKPNSVSEINVDFSGAPMTKAEKAAYAESNLYFANYADKYDAYKVSKEIGAGATVKFNVTATLAGTYYYFYDYDVEAIEYSETTFNSAYFSGTYDYKAGQLHVITAENTSNAAATAELVIVVPCASYVTATAVSSNIPLTQGKAGTNAVVAFTPEATGVYTLTVLGDVSAVATAYDMNPDPFIADEDLPADSDYKTGATASFLVNAPYLGRTVYFAITLKANSYPANFSVKIEKTADSIDNETTKQVSETLTQQSVPEGKELFGIPMTDGTAGSLTFSNGKYYYNDKLVYVKLTSALEANRFSMGLSLAYMDIGGIFSPDYVFTETTDTGSNIVDYRLFIRGFKDYEYQEGMGSAGAKIPSVLEEENCYANFVNEDGAYPLTQELKEFLEKFYAANEVMFFFQLPFEAMDSDSAWLFPCYYYDEEIVADDIVGEYKLLSYVYQGDSHKVGDEIQVWDDELQTMVPAYVTADDFKLVIDKSGTFTIYKLYEEYDSEMTGTWTKSADGTYSFVVTYMWGGGINFTVTFDKDAHYIKLVGDDAIEEDDYTQPATTWEFGDKAPAGEDDTPDYSGDAILGEYKFVSYKNYEGGSAGVGDNKPAGPGAMGEPEPYTADDFKLEVNSDGTFTIYIWDTNPFTQQSFYTELVVGTWSKSGTTYTFIWPDGAFEGYTQVDLILTATLDNASGTLTLSGDNGAEEDSDVEWKFSSATASEDDTQD